MGISERRERDRQKMRKMILETAMDLFIQDGYDRVSIRRIAERIEYSPTTVYLYFMDKDEIFFDLHEEGFQKLIQYQKKALSIKDPLERLFKSGEVYLKFAFENPEYYNLMFIFEAPMRKIADVEQWGCGMESYGIHKKMVADCIEAGCFEAENVDTAALAFWGFVHGLATLAIRQRLKMIPEEQQAVAIEQARGFFNNFIKKSI